ncbi:hypothetical protein LINPERHAP1_LOCUS40957, partial [Linum perenne]
MLRPCITRTCFSLTSSILLRIELRLLVGAPESLSYPGLLEVPKRHEPIVGWAISSPLRH